MSRVHSFSQLFYSEDISTLAHLLSELKKFMEGRYKWSDVEGRTIYAE
jgi:hypothetical protein